jgi:pimeloyl-ACP methyl ester carboxylesterase
MYDLRGHGHSERPPTGYHLDNFVDDLEALLAELAIYRPVYLFGNSFGGTIAFSYATRYPQRVAALATIESAPPTEGWIKRVILRLEGAADFLPREHALTQIGANRGQRAARRAHAVREVLSATTLVHDISASRLPGHDQIAGISCPVLCVYGGDSGVATLAPVVRRLLPQARTVVLPGQRHSILIDQPELIRELILSWLDSRPDRDREAGLDRPVAPPLTA